MSMRDFLRSAGFDFLLCLLAAGALAFVNCGAFNVDPAVQHNPGWVLLFSALPLLCFYGASYSKRTVVPGIALSVVLLLAYCLGGFALGGGDYLFQDTEANPVPFLLVEYLCALLSFLLTRRRWGCRAFVILVILDISFVEFMYKQHYLAALVVALGAAVALMIMRNYRANLREASSTQVSFTAAFLVAAGYAALLLGAAGLVFALVVAPLNPPAKELKLFTVYLNYEQVEVTGVGYAVETEDPDNTTSKVNDQIDTTAQEQFLKGEQEREEQQDDSLGSASQDVEGTGEESTEGPGLLKAALNYLIDHLWLLPLLALLLLALLAAPFALKKLLRARRFQAMCAEPPSLAVQDLFLFFVKRFRLLGVRQQPGLTLGEFAAASEGALAEFSANERNVTFGRLVAIYAACVYGGREPSPEELEDFKAFYGGFYKAFAKASGRFKYMLRFFRV